MEMTHFKHDPYKKIPCDDCPHRFQIFGGPPFLRNFASLGPPVKPSGGRGRPDTLSRIATNWLREYLKDGPKPTGNKNKPVPGTLFGDAVASGLKCGTVWDAANRLGIRKEKIGKRWYWSLPTENNR